MRFGEDMFRNLHKLGNHAAQGGGLARPLMVAGLSVATLMIGFEATKQFFFPHIPIWQSHASTIGFTSAVSMLVSYFLMRRLVLLNREREEAQAAVKVLSGLLSICASCKRIRDEEGHWEQLEIYIRDRSTADFSHSCCPECAQKLYGKA